MLLRLLRVLAIPRSVPLRLYVVVAFCLFAGAARHALASSSTTTFTVTAGGVSTNSVTPGTVVTLSASVLTNGVPVTRGQISFCDAHAPLCADIHLIGSAQLTSAGIATFRFIPGPGSHTYQAVFVGTTSIAASTSSTQALAVGGTASPSAATLTATGSPGNYTLTATVSGTASIAPTGTVSFLDTTAGNDVLATAQLVVGPTDLEFSNVSNPPIAVQPGSVAVGDFNGDGIPDLAVPAGDPLTANSVVILLGHGDGTFTPAATFSVGTGPSHIIVADFNSDGNLDIAFSDFSDNMAEVWLGNGAGAFTRASSNPTGQAPLGVVSNDFNRDGIPDLAVVNGFGGVTVLLGKGDGTFTAEPNAPTSTLPREIVSADLNGDSFPDLVVANSSDNSLSILLGNGDGTFTQEELLPAGLTPYGLVAGDFNGDGILDLVNVDFGTDGGTISYGKGDGTFTVNVALSPGDTPYSLAVGDFNGDGNADLITTNFNGTTVTAMLGDGKGNFNSLPALTTDNNPIFIATGDFNGDGRSDFAITTGSASVVPVYLSGATSSTATVTGISPVGTGIHYVDASYPGDSLYASTLSNAVPLIAETTGTTTTTALTCTPTTLSVNNFSLFSILVSSASGIPTGSISLTDNGIALAQLTLTNGAASYTLTARQAGTRTIIATYVPTGSFAPSSASCVLTVNGYATTATLSVSPTVANQGSPITLFANVAGGPPGFRGSPVGSITFYNGSTVIDMGAELQSGATSFTTTTLPPGIDYLTCSYSGNSTFAPATCNTVAVIITQSSAAISLTSSLNPAPALTPITFTAQVAPGSSGTIVFNINGQNISTTPNSAGTSSTTTSSLAPGTYLITATYYATPNALTAEASLSQQVTVPVAAPDFSLTGTDTTFTINHNGTGKLLLASLGTFAGTVALTCNPPYPKGYTCTVQTPNVTLPLGFSTNVVYTLSPNESASSRPLTHSTRVALAALFPLSFFGLIGLARKRRSALRAILSLTLLAIVATALTACGPDQFIPITTGTFPITFTATGTSQGDPTPITHTVTIQATITP